MQASLFLAGGNNAGIIWEGIATRSVRDDIINAGFTHEQAKHVYQIIDPIKMAKYNKTKNLLMINGLYDEIMPIRYTNELWEALGRPKNKMVSLCTCKRCIICKKTCKGYGSFHSRKHLSHILFDTLLKMQVIYTLHSVKYKPFIAG